MSNICKTVTLRTRKIKGGDLSVPVKRGSGISQRAEKSPGLSHKRKSGLVFDNVARWLVVSLCLSNFTPA